MSQWDHRYDTFEIYKSCSEKWAAAYYRNQDSSVLVETSPIPERPKQPTMHSAFRPFFER